MKNTFCKVHIVVTALLIISCLGCYTEKKATRQLIKIGYYYPKSIATYCNRHFPVVEYVRDSVVFLKGNITKKPVFIEVDCDTLMPENNVAGSEKMALRTFINHQVDTILVYKDRKVRDYSETIILQGEIKELTIEVAKKRNSLDILTKALIVLSVYTIVRWILRIWHIRIP